MANIVIVARIKVKNEFRDEVYGELLKLHKATNANDEGCLQYDLHKNLDDANAFTFIETWENANFLSKHTKKEHFVAFNKNVENKLESFEVSKLEKI